MKEISLTYNELQRILKGELGTMKEDRLVAIGDNQTATQVTFSLDGDEIYQLTVTNEELARDPTFVARQSLVVHTTEYEVI